MLNKNVTVILKDGGGSPSTSKKKKKEEEKKTVAVIKDDSSPSLAGGVANATGGVANRAASNTGNSSPSLAGGVANATGGVANRAASNTGNSSPSLAGGVARATGGVANRAASNTGNTSPILAKPDYSSPTAAWRTPETFQAIPWSDFGSLNKYDRKAYLKAYAENSQREKAQRDAMAQAEAQRINQERSDKMLADHFYGRMLKGEQIDVKVLEPKTLGALQDRAYEDYSNGAISYDQYIDLPIHVFKSLDNGQAKVYNGNTDNSTMPLMQTSGFDRYRTERYESNASSHKGYDYDISKQEEKSYTISFNNDLNGIGLTAKGEIILGVNATQQDALALISIANMTSKGYSDSEILNFVDSYVESKNGDTVIKKGKLLNYYTNFQDITDLLTERMSNAEKEYATWYFGIDSADVPLLWTTKLYEFYENVRNKGIWDLKQQDEWQQSSLYYFNGELVDADAPGNIMYGYMGSAYGIPESVLHIGAGYAQLSAGTADPVWLATGLGDDPKDTRNVIRGVEYYRNHHN